MHAFTLSAALSWVDARRTYRDVRPVDPPRAHASGPAPYRVLAVGGGLLAGAGVLTHDLALTGALARGLARQVGHGVDVQSFIDERGGVDAALRALRHRDLSKVDALVLVLDLDEDLSDPSGAAKRIARLVNPLFARLTSPAGVAVVMPPTAAQRDAAEGEALAAAVARHAGGPTRVVRLADRLLVQSAVERYAIWGDVIAATVAEGLAEPALWRDAVEQLDEPRRLAAVQRLGPLDQDWEAGFRRIVRFARQAYGAGCASMNIVGGDCTRFVVRNGFDASSVPREQSMCDLALRTYGGLIVGDATADDRFREFPLVMNGSMRFYAGHRVEGPDGQPLGVLCVFDREPRPVLEQDLCLLRDFAASAQRRIWELTQEDGGRSGRGASTD